ncbi:MAG: hypothetical protein M1827_006135 [Pycnora praestabilis]|nr:MAG: hypothetical protein M1827_006135 [Pycnora praestabilis]
MSSTQTTPEVLWAQRSSKTDETKNIIFLTISVPDVPDKNMKLDLKPTGLTFTGHSDTKKTTYHLALEFYEEIDVENSKTHHTARDVEMVLRKKDLKEEYWPRLLKEKAKVHFLKTDFDKWVDEDEQDAVPEDADYMNNMGGGGGGMPGMGGMGGEDGGFGGIDFSKLGAGGEGMGGMGGMGGMPPGMEGLMSGMGGAGGMGGMGGEDMDEDEDEDMPELEDDGEGEAEGKGKSAATIPKIEEISEAAAKGESSTPSASKDTAKIEEVS